MITHKYFTRQAEFLLSTTTSVHSSCILSLEGHITFLPSLFIHWSCIQKWNLMGGFLGCEVTTRFRFWLIVSRFMEAALAEYCHLVSSEEGPGSTWYLLDCCDQLRVWARTARRAAMLQRKEQIYQIFQITRYLDIIDILDILDNQTQTCRAQSGRGRCPWPALASARAPARPWCR